MRKLFVALALASASVAGMAQDSESTVPEDKYSVATSSFWSNWFVQANLVGTSFHSDETWASDNAHVGLLDGQRTNLGFSAALGKWFTPGLGLRTKFAGIWGRTVAFGDKSENASKYWNLNEDVLFNLSNIFCGYNERRVWNFVPYLGFGVARNMSYDKYAMNVGAGVLNTFRLTDKLSLNLELAYNAFDPGFSGWTATNVDRSGLKRLKNNDLNLSLEIGVTYNLGRARFKKTPDVETLRALSQGQIDALNAQLADAQSENSRLKDILASKPGETESKTVKEVVAAPVSVFFHIGKSKIASRKDLQNVRELAEVAKASGSKIVVTGYADSKTGSARFNKALSQRRADVVAGELVKMGVGRDCIEVVAAGGVNTLSPVSYNRRATVTIK